MQKIISRYEADIPDCLVQQDLHPLLKKIYANRGVRSLNELDLGLSGLLPFHALSQIDKAVDILYEALQKQQKIIIIGDYDVDGATSTALAVRLLRAFGAENVEFLVPNRFTYGYGLSPEIVNLAALKNPDVLVTVDNGISSLNGVLAANALNIDVIVTDHHLAGSKLPEATAIVNPNQPKDKFPSKNLAGVGVLFYVMLALRAKLRACNWFEEMNIKEPNLSEYLDLVALGTVADMVSMDKNNRILVDQGLRRICAGKCCVGITAILQVASRSQSNIVASDLGYTIGPRLNAAGRLEEMSLGVNCLLTDDFSKALAYATELEKLNVERRSIEHEMRQEALALIDHYPLHQDEKLPHGLCLMNENWHQGVVGIIASRIKDQLHRPTIVFAQIEDDVLKGSARSIPKLHLRDALANIALEYPDLIMRFGGHAMAAGLVIPKKRYQEFADIFDRQVRQTLNENDFACEYITDGALEYEYFDVDIAALLKHAGPWGQDFQEPLFDGRFHVLDQRLVGSKHLKITLEFQAKRIDAIAFNVDLNAWPNHRCEFIEAVYRMDVNSFRGRQSLQLIVEHLEPV